MDEDCRREAIIIVFSHFENLSPGCPAGAGYAEWGQLAGRRNGFPSSHGETPAPACYGEHAAAARAAPAGDRRGRGGILFSRVLSHILSLLVVCAR